jgi:hypothetical protein
MAFFLRVRRRLGCDLCGIEGINFRALVADGHEIQEPYPA